MQIGPRADAALAREIDEHEEHGHADNRQAEPLHRMLGMWQDEPVAAAHDSWQIISPSKQPDSGTDAVFILTREPERTTAA